MWLPSPEGLSWGLDRLERHGLSEGWSGAAGEGQQRQEGRRCRALPGASGDIVSPVVLPQASPQGWGFPSAAPHGLEVLGRGPTEARRTLQQLLLLCAAVRSCFQSWVLFKQWKEPMQPSEFFPTFKRLVFQPKACWIGLISHSDGLYFPNSDVHTE